MASGVSVVMVSGVPRANRVSVLCIVRHCEGPFDDIKVDLIKNIVFIDFIVR